MARNGGKKPLTDLAEAFHSVAEPIKSGARDIDLPALARACALVSPLIKTFGPQGRLADMEYKAKADDLLRASESATTLASLIDADIDNNSVRLSGSHTRNLLRMKQAHEMIKVLFGLLLEVKGNSLEMVFFTAYITVFSHHMPALRNAASDAMLSIPTKSQLLKKINETEESANDQMRKYIEASAIIIDFINKLLISKGVGTDW